MIGVDIESDLTFLCAGTQINSKCYEKLVTSSILDQHRRIIVGPHLQVGQHTNIFAIGDASSAEVTLIGSAVSQVPYCCCLFYLH
jgi:NADH dehydrogenase FAD-containing subunit